MLLVPLTLLLLAQAPPAAPGLRTEVLVGPLSVGLGGELPLSAKDAVSAEAAVGLQFGVGSVAEVEERQAGSVRRVAGYSGALAEVLRLSVAWRRALHPNVSVDLGARASWLLFPGGDDTVGGSWFVGAIVQPSLGNRRVRFTPSLMVGSTARPGGLWSTTLVLQPVGFTVFF